ncbi:MAG: Tuberculostearic acid methyltransferase UfaA1 [Candidatus Celerinatantimonas neptuna]|nr:MAG: Tuberculostearic acid methyltransferase UfaA1 [Candidatus Celerinatantimonas neptuna]
MLKTRRLPLNWFNPKRKIAKTLFTRFLANLVGAKIRLQSHHSTELLGDPQSDQIIDIIIHDPCVYERIISGGSIEAAETYIEGLWKTSDLHALLKIAAFNQARLDKLESGISKLAQWTAKLRYKQHKNRKSQAKRNILSHYDLGNYFYSTFLDKQMQYSCALFDESSINPQHPENGLEQAQQQKIKRISKQLQLTSDDHLLEIGTGWGGLAIYAAQHYGCQVTTTTISDQQYQYCCEQIHQLGLENKIQVLNRDYRDLHGYYDKLVSIEMIEAVGETYLPLFIRQCSKRLKPGGMMLLQSITIADKRYQSYRKNTDFIQQLVFPGGFLPCESVLKTLFTKYNLQITDYLDMREHYIWTLRAWYHRLQQYRQKHSQTLGFNSQFFRLWNFYLAYSEAGFASSNTGVCQFTLTHQ